MTLSKKILTMAACTILLFNAALPQVAINTNGASADNSAMLDISSTSKGLLIPRMTTIQREAVTGPAAGLIVYDIDVKCLYYYDGTAWFTFVTTSADAPLILMNSKSAMTADGGFAVKLINKTGNTVKKGTLVSISNTEANGFILAGQTTSHSKPIGVVYEEGANNAECWIIVSGIAQILLKNGISANTGDLIGVSDVNGRVYTISSGPASVTEHDKEVGHCIETKTSGTDVLIKTVIHFR